MQKYFKVALVLIASFILILALAAKQAGAETVTDKCNAIAQLIVNIKEGALSGVDGREYVMAFVENGVAFAVADEIVRKTYSSPLPPKELGYSIFSNCLQQHGEAL